MPFKSQAQRRKFAELLLKGEISNQTFEQWNRETGSAKLPERVQPKARRKLAPKRNNAEVQAENEMNEAQAVTAASNGDVGPNQSIKASALDIAHACNNSVTTPCHELSVYR